MYNSGRLYNEGAQEGDSRFGVTIETRKSRLISIYLFIYPSIYLSNPRPFNGMKSIHVWQGRMNKIWTQTSRLATALLGHWENYLHNLGVRSKSWLLALCLHNIKGR